MKYLELIFLEVEESTWNNLSDKEQYRLLDEVFENAAYWGRGSRTVNGVQIRVDWQDGDVWEEW